MATRRITPAVLKRAGRNPAARARVQVGARLINPGLSPGAIARALGNSPARGAPPVQGRRKAGVGGG